MSDSILETIKKMLGLPKEIEDFDLDLIMFINSALAKLHQIGIGPDWGFEIDGYDQTWSDLAGGDPTFNDVKMFVFLETKIIFDPPQVASLNSAYERQLKEVTWRLNAKREDREWQHPSTGLPVQLNLF